jgi:hypothetical protein
LPFSKVASEGLEKVAWSPMMVIVGGKVMKDGGKDG